MVLGLLSLSMSTKSWVPEPAQRCITRLTLFGVSASGNRTAETGLEGFPHPGPESGVQSQANCFLACPPTVLLARSTLRLLVSSVHDLSYIPTRYDPRNTTPVTNKNSYWVPSPSPKRHVYHQILHFVHIHLPCHRTRNWKKLVQQSKQDMLTRVAYAYRKSSSESLDIARRNSQTMSPASAFVIVSAVDTIDSNHPPVCSSILSALLQSKSIIRSSMLA